MSLYHYYVEAEGVHSDGLISIYKGDLPGKYQELRACIAASMDPPADPMTLLIKSLSKVNY